MTAPQPAKRQRISMNPRGPKPYPYKTTQVRVPVEVKEQVIEIANRYRINALNLAGRKNKRINP